MMVKCEKCGREFKSYSSNKSKYCGWECYHLSRIGRPWSSEMRRKMSLKDTVPWNKGKHYKLSEETKNKMRGRQVWNKGKEFPQVRGDKNCNFNGGFSYNQGRVLIVCRDYSIVPYARIVLQNKIGRELKKNEITHHVNGNTSDDRPENLELLTRGEHLRLHYKHIAQGIKYSKYLRKELKI